MTNEIEEKARAFVDKIMELKIELLTDGKEMEELTELKQVLNPKPSRDEVIENLKNLISGNIRTNLDHSIEAAIEYLQQPTNQWIENIGEMPDCKMLFAENEDNEYLYDSPGELEWSLHELCSIKRYMIIEK